MTVSLINGKRKYIFCGDEASLEVLQPIIYEVKKKELPFEIVPLDSSTLQNLLSSQKMGTFLYIAAPWKLKREIEKMAWSIGYSEEEMISVGIGPKPMNVFCCRCHGITEKINLIVDEEITCSHCELQLVVSDHYSSLRDAHLGYVAKL
ncbi:dimethylamine monooxygenase subunit DmmA family protein [Sutcliffiella cohnii]|uniref:Dimethylamine monooxygenase subunit DmmA-like C-terminal domain-containing protein n=1 Tax=Sutcliffiella cohnii TaxID=33932 RepID=A0A223KWT2_9BACI|nr:MULTISPECIES: dimethylamine monooxygenase subunit DmmA family protein [Sutcliffiella]AST93864.1 hypothetical protein BC6307_22595 [Sutcliffiella cohnii]WBL15056.1 dimethylamine monooxygenase subunit DmmA family protein [Sutcliffiella sp. NC1]